MHKSLCSRQILASAKKWSKQSLNTGQWLHKYGERKWRRWRYRNLNCLFFLCRNAIPSSMGDGKMANKNGSIHIRNDRRLFTSAQCPSKHNQIWVRANSLIPKLTENHVVRPGHVPQSWATFDYASSIISLHSHFTFCNSMVPASPRGLPLKKTFPPWCSPALAW